MAREVNTTLAQIIAENRKITPAKAEEVVKSMRAANQYQVRSDYGFLRSPPFSGLKTFKANLFDFTGGRLVLDATISINKDNFPRLCVDWKRIKRSYIMRRIWVGGQHDEGRS